MIVHYMCNFYSFWAAQNIARPTDAQWDAIKFCKAVKRREINGSCSYPWPSGKPEVINSTSVGRARVIFGGFAQSTLIKFGLKNAILIPVPSKDGLVGAADFRSASMVYEAMASYGTWSIAPVIRLSESLKPASLGGPRGREKLRPYMRLAGPIGDGPIVLVDDLMTQGGSLQAAADILRTIGRKPELAIVCGHTVSSADRPPFGLYTQELPID